MSSPLVFMDTETTGIHPGRRAWEIAMIRREIDGSEKEILIQIRDIDLSNADPFGLAVGKFYERYYYADGRVDPRTKLMLEVDAAQFIWMFTKGAHIVGAIPSFDTETLDTMLRRHKLLPAWHYHIIDVEALAIGFLQGSSDFDRKKFNLPWKSKELSEAIGVSPPTEDELHTALGDARWAMRTYDRVMGN